MGALSAKKKQKAVLGRLFCGHLFTNNFYLGGLAASKPQTLAGYCLWQSS
jgi:hypothetical protein